MRQRREKWLTDEQMALNGVATAVVSEVKDPADLGRVQIHLPDHAGGTKEWARVVRPLIGRALTAFPLAIGDEVAVVFEKGDVTRPFVIGNLWNGVDSPPESAGARSVRLPAGATLHPIVEAANASTGCAMTADLQRQTAAWLASAECVLKILALVKPLIDVINQLPSPSLTSLRAFDNAAIDLAPCFLMGTPAGALPLVRDLLCLSLRSLECLRDQSASAPDVLRVAAGIQGVLDLGGTFFIRAGLPPVRLAVLSDPGALDSDITALQSAADALGGCGK
jgi:hypothetical protein